jgi:phosphohistidine swiveling domain-containing protein
MTVSPTAEIDLDAASPTHRAEPQNHHWTTTNIGEAMPGVQTPLSWSVWRPVGAALREVGWAVGALGAGERADTDGLIEIFCGRAAFRVDPFVLLGDRLPGTSGRDVVESLLGRVPDGLAYNPTNRRLPIIASRFPATFARAPRELRRRAGEIDGWYARRVQTAPALDRTAAIETLLEAQTRLIEMVRMQTIIGVPEPRRAADAADGKEAIAGIGVSAGIAEGRARVVLDPATADVAPDEILIAPTTDPSWAPVMFISAALVVDIGGALSHAAIVARELGVPCVVNTGTGTRTIRTGDRCRVDGTSGRVQILERNHTEVI